MTAKGEELTVKGEFPGNKINSVNDIAFCYSKRSAGKNQDEAVNTALPFASQPLFQMVFTLKGNITFSDADLKKDFVTIGDQQHNLMLVYPEKLSSKYIEDQQHEIIYITFSPSFLFRYLPQEHSSYLHLSTALAAGRPAVFSKQNMHVTPEINAILNSIDNSPHKGFCERLFLESKMIELLTLQISQFEYAKENNQVLQLKREALDKMHEAREILVSNIEKPLTLRRLAHMVGTNEFNLKKHFKTAFGITVYGYLNQHKMVQARAMLIEGESKVAEVSVKMGYKHATHFTSAFKKYFGYLPTKIKMGLLLFDPEFLVLLSENLCFLEL